MNVEQITEFLNKHDIKPSYQRIKVYEHLIQCKEHPTAELLYRELVKTIPTLSKTTIYNSLKTFVAKGIVKVISIEGNELRYDPILEEHGYFHCNVCGKIYNIPLDETTVLPKELDGFLIEERIVYLKGICKQCNQ